MELEKRLFVGMKVSKQLQSGLDSPAPGTDHYFKSGSEHALHIVNVGGHKLIGRYLQDGFPINDLDNVGRNVRSIVRLITRGQRLDEDTVQIYVADPSLQQSADHLDA